jgi:hypothetical protein
MTDDQQQATGFYELTLIVPLQSAAEPFEVPTHLAVS